MQEYTMEKNMGLADRIIRTAASIALVEIVTNEKVPASIRGGLLMMSGVLIATSMMGSCPAYSALGISTKKNVNYADYNTPRRVF